MKQLKQFLQNIPRKIQICINIFTITLLLAAGYIFLSCPALTPEQQFRRLEKANLVGPSEIIEIITVPNGSYDHVLVADEADAVILYGFNISNFRWDQGLFLYREKEAGITVFPAPTQHWRWDEPVIDLPILLFHNHPKAYRAELELTLGEGLGIQQTQWQQGAEVSAGIFEKTYHLESHSDTAGYFRFDLHAEIEGTYVTRNGIEVWEYASKEGAALQAFSRMFSHNRVYLSEYVPATVRLYDRSDNLIAEEHLTIRSVPGDRCAREEGSDS